MRSALVTVSLVAALFAMSCSKDDSSTTAPKRVGRSYVPATAAEIANSPSFKLEHTTPGGIQYYVCPLSTEIARSISVDSPDYRFLTPGDSPCFLVPVRDGRMVDLNAAEAAEVSDYLSKRGKK